MGSTPEQFAAAIKADMAKWSQVIKQAGIHARSEEHTSELQSH